MRTEIRSRFGPARHTEETVVVTYKNDISLLRLMFKHLTYKISPWGFNVSWWVRRFWLLHPKRRGWGVSVLRVLASLPTRNRQAPLQDHAVRRYITRITYKKENNRAYRHPKI